MMTDSLTSRNEDASLKPAFKPIGALRNNVSKSMNESVKSKSLDIKTPVMTIEDPSKD